MQTVRAQAGFTLLELIIVMVIMSTIITLAIFPSVLAGMNAYGATVSNVVVLDKLRYASERMGYEIRELATASITSSPLPAIPTAAAPFSFTDSASVKTVSLYLKPASSSTQCDGSVILTYSAPVLTPAPLATETSAWARSRDCAKSCIKAPLPVLTSRTSASSPAASFLERIEATISEMFSTVAVTSRTA